MVNHLSTWSWNASNDVLQAPPAPTQEQLDGLVAATRLPYVQRAVLKIQGLCLEQIGYIAERAPQTVPFVLVDPLGKPADYPGAPPGLTQTARLRAWLRPLIHPNSAEIISAMIPMIHDGVPRGSSVWPGPRELVGVLQEAWPNSEAETAGPR